MNGSSKLRKVGFFLFSWLYGLVGGIIGCWLIAWLASLLIGYLPINLARIWAIAWAICWFIGWLIYLPLSGLLAKLISDKGGGFIGSVVGLGVGFFVSWQVISWLADGWLTIWWMVAWVISCMLGWMIGIVMAGSALFGGSHD